MAEERTFQIQLEGLIQLLAQNLYADPDVFLREMIQNAHDSITRRAELAAERGEPDPPSPRIQPAERAQVGTTVTLQVSPAHSRYLERGRLESIIRTYADFIGMPVYVNDDADPTNAVNAPWHRKYPTENDRDLAYRDFWSRKFADEHALHVFAVDESFRWPDAERPGGEGTGRVRGVLAITDRHVPDV